MLRPNPKTMIYLDHAATSWPKPPEVMRAMAGFLESAGGNPGRSGHRLSIAAGRIVYEAREAVAGLLHAPDPLRVIFTQNATHALNIALHGLLSPGDRVVTSGMEHNAVMRPLRALEKRGVAVVVVPTAPDGTLNPVDFARAVMLGTRLVALNHASNVVGTIAPAAEVAQIAHAAGALLLIDAAQTAGVMPLDMQAMGIDLLAFTGHKGLHGPPGSGGLVLGEGVDAAQIRPLLQGGTGSRSEYEEQPEFLPDKFESGTPNGVGIAGLGAGIQWVMARGMEAIRAHEVALTRRLVAGLSEIPGVRLYGLADPQRRTAVVSFTVEGWRVSTIGLRLDEEHGVLCRVGLHCAPAAHRTIGTFPEGTVRFAPGPLTTLNEIDAVVDAVKQVVQS
ncbi:MAG: aminotransferase class V-fold PLP-dependent enzyme [Anaerolineales bacterium]|nr:aminotransferase class V-fold PLP-dependent enzyme [Anaerolineales bacterium]